MSLTRPDSRQILNRAALSKIGAAANTTQDSLNSKFNIELDSPLRLAASFPTPDAQLNFSNSLLTAADGANKVLPPVSSQVFESLTGAFINFQTQALSNAAHFIITFPSSTVGQFRRAGFTLTSAGKIQVLFSAEAASEGALANPGTVFVSGVPLGYVNLVGTVTSGTGAFKTAGSATNIIENAKIYRFGAGGGAGSSSSGSGLGDDLNSLSFKASFADDFSDIPSASTSAIDTSRTTASYDAVSAAYRMSYDASKTVTGTGVNMTLSGTPAYTVVAGDVLVVGSEARRIVTVNTQTSYVLESAFSSDPSAAAACVSQAVHTNDVRAHTENSTGLAISAVISDSVSGYILRYRDSAAASDAIWDFPGAALVAFSASADNSSWSTVQSRVSAISTTESIRSVPVSGSQFRARFFANATSGSGAVNVLDYKVFLHQDTNTSSGATAYQAIGRTDAAGTEVNCAISSDTGKTRITTTFAFGSEVQVFLDGQKVPEFVDAIITPDASFSRISASVIELDSDYSGLGLQVEVIVPSNTVDNTNLNSSNITALQNMAAAGFQGMVDESSLLAPVTGTPAAGQFRTFGIVGRARIPDLANDLKARMGFNRMPIQQIFQISSEMGSSGEQVYGVLNDDRNQVRLVGSGWTNLVNNNGIRPYTDTQNDFIEIVFYGTGLNLLTLPFNTALDSRVTVDGGAEGSNIFSSSASGALNSRNYATNQVINVASGLSLGLHTIKIRNNNSTGSGNGLNVYGVEMITESTTINVRPGVSYQAGKKLVLSSAQSLAYSSSFDSILRDGSSVGSLGARGARVIVYQKADGSIGKAAIETNSASATLSSADHTNEEIARNIYYREFGSGRSDDWSLTFSSSIDLAYTLEDDSTTLIGTGINASVGIGSADYYEGFGPSNGNFFMLTFVGTGLDLYADTFNSGLTATISISVDGTSIFSGVPSSLFLKKRITKIVSGLPYGTHTLKIAHTSAGTTPFYNRFVVYQPKKPSLPSGAIELADYNVMATFVANSTAATDTVSTGVLRKVALREFVYANGTGGTTDWSVQAYDNRFIPLTSVSTDRQNAFIEYPFFGSGFDMRFWLNTSRDSNITVTLNGLTANTTNFPTLSSGTYGDAGVSFNASTGILDLSTTAASVPGCGFYLSGLPVGKYTLKLNKNTAGGSAFLQMETIDVITPIHSTRSNIPADLQNTLMIGSGSLNDNRNTSLIRSESPKKNWVQAQGIASGPSSTSTALVPIPDMFVCFKTAGGRVQINHNIVLSTAGGAPVFTQVAVNGIFIGTQKTGGPNSSSESEIVVLPAGTYTIQVYWAVSSGTVNALGTMRTLTVADF